MADLKLVNEEFIGLRFPYDQEAIRQIRELDNRRWNPADRQWEIHIAHLPKIMQIFYLHPQDIPRQIMEIYQKNWSASTFQIRIDNVTSQFMGTSFPVDKIDDITSFRVCGAEFNPKYNDGSWDGKRHLFNRREYTFPTGLLPRILTFFKGSQTGYKLKDSRIIPPPVLQLRKPEIELRPYQEMAVQKALEHKRGILEMATGSGKTLVAAYLIHHLNLPTIFFVHTRELLYQTKDYFEKQLGIPIGQIGDGKITIAPITVATIQTIVRALGGKYIYFDEEDQDDTTHIGHKKEEIIHLVQNSPVIFFDECHHLPADTCYTVAMHTQAAYYRYGLSATPYRADRQDMLIESALGPKITRINASFLIDQKHLVPPSVLFLNTGSIKNLESKDYSHVYQHFIVQNGQRNKSIAEYALAYANKGITVLILVQQIKHGEELIKLIKGAEFIQGNDSTARRNKILKDFKDKKLRILVATTLADEGLDVPTLGAVILAGGGKSETRALQRVGRALRPYEEKTEAVIIDFLDNAPFLKDHSMKRLEIFKTEPRFKISLEGDLPFSQSQNFLGKKNSIRTTRKQS